MNWFTNLFEDQDENIKTEEPMFVLNYEDASGELVDSQSNDSPAALLAIAKQSLDKTYSLSKRGITAISIKDKDDKDIFLAIQAIGDFDEDSNEKLNGAWKIIVNDISEPKNPESDNPETKNIAQEENENFNFEGVNNMTNVRTHRSYSYRRSNNSRSLEENSKSGRLTERMKEPRYKMMINESYELMDACRVPAEDSDKQKLAALLYNKKKDNYVFVQGDLDIEVDDKAIEDYIDADNTFDNEEDATEFYDQFVAEINGESDAEVEDDFEDEVEDDDVDDTDSMDDFDITDEDEIEPEFEPEDLDDADDEEDMEEDYRPVRRARMRTEARHSRGDETEVEYPGDAGERLYRELVAHGPHPVVQESVRNHRHSASRYNTMHESARIRNRRPVRNESYNRRTPTYSRSAAHVRDYRHPRNPYIG